MWKIGVKIEPNFQHFKGKSKSPYFLSKVRA